VRHRRARKPSRTRAEKKNATDDATFFLLFFLFLLCSFRRGDRKGDAAFAFAAVDENRGHLSVVLPSTLTMTVHAHVRRDEWWG
jgi:hypothetical protein